VTPAGFLTKGKTMAEIKHNWTEQGMVTMLRRQVAELTQQKEGMNRQYRGRIPDSDERWQHMVLELNALRKKLDEIEHKLKGGSEGWP
jgi:hypothetical protein